MGRKIILRPMAKINSHILEILKQSLKQTFNRPVEIKAQTSNPDYTYDPKRKQYLAPPLLSTMRSFNMEQGERCLGIVDVDLYSPGLNFIFGEADTDIKGISFCPKCQQRLKHMDLPLLI